MGEREVGFGAGRLGPSPSVVPSPLSLPPSAGQDRLPLCRGRHLCPHCPHRFQATVPMVSHPLALMPFSPRLWPHPRPRQFSPLVASPSCGPLPWSTAPVASGPGCPRAEGWLWSAVPPTALSPSRLALTSDPVLGPPPLGAHRQVPCPRTSAPTGRVTVASSPGVHTCDALAFCARER